MSPLLARYGPPVLAIWLWSSQARPKPPTPGHLARGRPGQRGTTFSSSTPPFWAAVTMSSFTCSFSKEMGREPFVPELGGSPLSASEEPGSNNQKNIRSPASLQLADKSGTFTPSRRAQGSPPCPACPFLSPIPLPAARKEAFSSCRNDCLLVHTANSTLGSAKAKGPGQLAGGAVAEAAAPQLPLLGLPSQGRPSTGCTVRGNSPGGHQCLCVQSVKQGEVLPPTKGCVDQE